ncbi:MAG: exodeoxyribonuclease VII small subunit [Clostridiales bacterium]|jgi:exodeoxyribonuclease VII small subunit|nr:exodeoxyribonuclease VII small subunit [Clostridiales bacterium]
MAEDNKEKFNIEEAMAKLEEINGKLAADDIALDESMKLYKEGVELANKCRANLEGVKKELEIINADSGAE